MRIGGTLLAAACCAGFVVASTVRPVSAEPAVKPVSGEPAVKPVSAEPAVKPVSGEPAVKPVSGAPVVKNRGSGATGVYERSVVEVAPAPTVALGRVHIDNRLGDVKIVGHDGNGVVIEATKRAPDAATLDRLKVRLIPDPSGAVLISTSLAMGNEARPIRAGSVRIDLIIRAPRNARAVARVWNGRIGLAGMEGGAELGNNIGDIDVRNASGRITTRSSRGAQHFAEVVGTVEAQSLVGNMDLRLIRGDSLDAMVHKGDIVGRDVRSRRVSVRTSRGNVQLSVHPSLGGRVYASSHHGNVEVKLAGATAVTVWARAARGKVDLAGVKRGPLEADGAVVGAAGAGRAPSVVRLQSSFGDIRFKLVRN